MSIPLPALELRGLQREDRAPTPADRLPQPPLAWLPTFEPRRSRIVSWPVRIAEIADRVVARTLAAPPASRGRDRGFAHFALAGFDCCCRLVPRHQQAVLAERAHLKIRRAIEHRRGRHQRFQELRRAMRDHRIPREDESDCLLHLNPANCWLRWESAPCSAEESGRTSSAMFFLDGSALRGLRMQLEGQVLINELADYQPCTVAQWAHLSALVDAPQLIALVRYLEEIGLVARG